MDFGTNRLGGRVNIYVYDLRSAWNWITEQRLALHLAKVLPLQGH